MDDRETKLKLALVIVKGSVRPCLHCSVFQPVFSPESKSLQTSVNIFQLALPMKHFYQEKTVQEYNSELKTDSSETRPETTYMSKQTPKATPIQS